MIAASLYERALNIALVAHLGQTDKGGHPYIQHPIAVALQFRGNEVYQAVALLHDVIEDSPVTEAQLRLEGMPEPVVVAVVALTRAQGESYGAYIKRVKQNSIARAVKIEDIKHNLRRDRVHDHSIRRLLEKNRPMYFHALADLDQQEG